MKIVIISAGGYMDYEDYAKGILLGTEYQIFGLSKKLCEMGHDVTILRKWHRTEINYVGNIKIISLKATNYKKPGLNLTLSKLKFSRFASKTIKSIDVDILVMIDPYTSYFAYGINIPKVLVTHIMHPYELLQIEDLGLIKRIFYYINKKMQIKIFKNSDVIVALNNQIADYLSKKGYKTILIPNGIDIDRYIPNYSDEKYILYGGRLIKDKGINYLINAYSMLSEDLQKEYKLVIIGFGAEKINLEKLVADFGIKDRVDFIPWLSTPEFMEKISNCVVFVLPSFHECMPVSVLEAMASGKTVIASDIPGIQDEITNNKNGFLFEAGNALEIKNKLDLLLRNEKLRQTTGAMARETVEEKFTFDKITDKYLDIFHMLLESK